MAVELGFGMDGLEEYEWAYYTHHDLAGVEVGKAKLTLGVVAVLVKSTNVRCEYPKVLRLVHMVFYCRCKAE
jgi:hypothetical protein